MRLVLWVIVVMSFFFHRSICSFPSPNQSVVCQLVVRVQKKKTKKKKKSESESESESKSESASPSGSQDWGQPQP